MRSGRGASLHGMRPLIYAMTASADGYVADRTGSIDWTVPDEELHRFHNERVRATAVQLCGRRLYETMLAWETVEQPPDAPAVAHEFAAIWKATPKLVFSRTLNAVEGNATLATASPAEEVARLKAQPGGELAVGAAGLAAECMRHDLIDEYHLFVAPVVLGGGTPFFAPLDRRLDLALVETRTFASRVAFLRYERRR